MAFRFMKFVMTRMAPTPNRSPGVPDHQTARANSGGSCPLPASDLAMRMALNKVALIEDAVAANAAIDTAMKPAWPSTGLATCATAVSASEPA